MEKIGAHFWINYSSETVEQTLCHSYRTIAARSEGQYTEKRSRFISFVIPVEDEDVAMALLQEVRKEYYDAHHVCWAYRIGIGEVSERANDDGEPSSTAGKPILGQLISHDLTNVMGVVVRYFGGVKLGPSGLIQAYRTATAEAITAGEVVEHIQYSSYRLSFPFDLIHPVMMLIRQYDVETLNNDATTDGYVWIIQVANARVQDFEQASETIYQLKVEHLENL